ncbi:S8 family serine peptidase [Nonomuraea sp. NPDC050153]|uniref:S8 family serine peptidase n=1 Tax=Nonomuraea sp. NPDC050153 TaxID=3364359 RepID=UPI0037A26B52
MSRLKLAVPVLIVLASLCVQTAEASAGPSPRPIGNGARYQFSGGKPEAQATPTPRPDPGPPDKKRRLVAREGFVPARAGHGVKDSYIVTLRQAATPQLAGSLAGRFDGTVRHVFDRVLQGFSVAMTEARAKRLAQDPAVESVQQDQVVTIAEEQVHEATQNDPVNWGLDRIDQENRPLSSTFTYVADRSSPDDRIYIIDTGINAYDYDEFDDEAGDSRVEWGTNTIDDDNDDCNGHGTHVAGIAAGRRSGVAKRATLVDVKVLGCNGGGTTTSVVKGVEWVVKNATPPDSHAVDAVINMSIQGPVNDAIDKAVKSAVDAGFTVVVAAGNSNQDACDISPARVPGTVTVGASAADDSRWASSNHGECVNIFAPGENILSSDYSNPGSVTSKSGTSMASPFVAGAATLLSLDEKATPSAVRDALIANSTKDKLTGIGSNSPNRLLYMGRKSRGVCQTDPTQILESAAPYSPLTEKWYNYAHQNRGWTGADGTYSTPGLEGTGRIWVFSDTFLAPVNTDDTRPETAPFINNSIVEETYEGDLITHTGGTAQSPMSIMPGTQDYWYWGGAPSVLNSGGEDRLQVVYQEYNRFGPGQWDWGWAANVVATFDPDDLGHPIDVTVLPSSQGVAWGAAILTDHSWDHYTYIYGVEDVHEGPIENPTAVYKYLHVARVQGTDLRRPWQFLDRNGDWMSEESFTAREYIAGTGQHVPVSNEFSVDAEGRLVTQDSSVAFSGEIYLYRGCSVSGPFSGKTFLYRTTEGGPWGDYGNENLFTYNAKAHDYYFSADSEYRKTLIISYNLNSLDWHDVYRNIRWYQPRFIKLVIAR